MEHGELVLKSCRICGRSFNLVSLDKHEKICETNKKVTKRTVFKSFCQRSREIDLVPVEKDDEKNKVKCGVQNNVKNSSTLRLLNNGQSSFKPIPSGYQQCPSCNRYFSPKAADRHIPWCQEQKIRLPKTPPNAVALERLQARTKYQAPRPRKKSFPNGNIRLVKSAESIREPSRLRTHSSPPLNTHDVSQNSQRQNIHNHKENGFQGDSFSSTKMKNPGDYSPSTCFQENESKKTVKFKEQFPIYTKDRNKNLDMLKALRLHLSQLSTSDDNLHNYILRAKEHEMHKSCSDIFSLPVVQEKSNVKVTYNDNTADDDIYLNKNENAEKRMPKFCYNCGTKYPVANAKYCCECGVQRFVFGISSQKNFVSECL